MKEGAGMYKRMYPQSSLTAFEQGARLDLRVRLAIDVLKSPSFAPLMEQAAKFGMPDLQGDGITRERAVATIALDIASALLDEAEKRGLVDDMPDHSDLNAAEKKQAERNAKFSVHGQMAGQRYAQSEQPMVTGTSNLRAPN